ncbi:MAG: CoA-binding protein [Algoriphagus sp.]|uniref:CoA-binding protein n=1 Tax=Algoriphagus sp. TaxID=1872435 RepID=UPI002606499E|nr:CoA-binding protein [Algoriphagus sp.]MDG1278614.1 CoA-binding protein [Algoriphagus sp.]
MREEKSKKLTLLVGATPNPSRFAYFAAGKFIEQGIDFIPIGIKKGKVFGKEILDIRSKPELLNIHTITLYLGEQNQEEWVDYFLSLKPKRIIFNPGAENFEFMRKAQKMGIEAINACNLVMLRTGQF